MAASYLDSLLDEAISFVMTENKVSLALIQRKFMIGYPRANNLLIVLEAIGVISAPHADGGREVVSYDREQASNLKRKLEEYLDAGEQIDDLTNVIQWPGRRSI